MFIISITWLEWIRKTLKTVKLSEPVPSNSALTKTNEETSALRRPASQSSRPAQLTVSWHQLGKLNHKWMKPTRMSKHSASALSRQWTDRAKTIWTRSRKRKTSNWHLTCSAKQTKQGLRIQERHACRTDYPKRRQARLWAKPSLHRSLPLCRSSKSQSKH